MVAVWVAFDRAKSPAPSAGRDKSLGQPAGVPISPVRKNGIEKTEIEKSAVLLVSLSKIPGPPRPEYLEELIRFATRFGALAVPFLEQLLQDPEWQKRCGVLRALACTDCPAARQILQNYIRDDLPIEEAAQAALALGQMSDPSITPWLIDKWGSVKEGDLKRALLETLVERPYGQTGRFLSSLLTETNVSAEIKSGVLVGLGFHQDAPLATILPYASNRDEMVRLGAYEALVYRPEARVGQKLLNQAKGESEAALRAQAYEAAGNQADVFPVHMKIAAQTETDAAARLRAERAWGAAVGRAGNAQDRVNFDQEAVPQLLQEALENPDPGEQRAALQALAMARTPAAREALQKISQQSSSPRLRKLADDLAKKISNPAGVLNQ